MAQHYQAGRQPWPDVQVPPSALTSGPAKAYVSRRIDADGKTWREAIRALKRQLVRPVFRLLVEGSEVHQGAD